MADNYHKDNLKELLIKTAIEVISKDGIDAISMRSLSLKCGVSRGAPYNYFKNKEEMLQVISDYVSDEFTNYLLKSIEGLDQANSKTLNAMGMAYIRFFLNNPYYYDFIYHNGLYKIVITLEEVEGNFKPFEVFRKLCVKLVNTYNIPKEVGLGSLVRCFSIVHGAASLFSSNNVVYEGDYEALIGELFNFGGK